jgi:hypothetical protein
MADTRHAAATPPPVEGDGINYAGIGWFVVILTVTTVVCAGLMWGLFWFLDEREKGSAQARSPLAIPVLQAPPPPNLLYVDTTTVPATPRLGEPQNLDQFRRSERHSLESYGWVDQNAGVVRIPIERAKDLLLERGLAVRGTPAPAEKAAATKGKD